LATLEYPGFAPDLEMLHNLDLQWQKVNGKDLIQFVNMTKMAAEHLVPNNFQCWQHVHVGARTRGETSLARRREGRPIDICDGGEGTEERQVNTSSSANNFLQFLAFSGSLISLD
jgi:hypothetical protein